MYEITATYLQELNLGTPQVHENMTVIPLFPAIVQDVEYVSLNVALEKKYITVTEIDQHGSVPNLKVINSSDHQVLLLDGEELIGAKQNRVLNTSILLKSRSETEIPVSCTEMGRWAYSSADFSSSGSMSARSIRRGVHEDVSASLSMGMQHSSDQAQVWSEIDEMHGSMGTSSPTGAMRDMYTQRTANFDEYSSAFELVPEQQGSLVFINGKVAGFDVISLRSAYENVHDQLIKSYAVDALLNKEEKVDVAVDDSAVEFLKNSIKSEESRFDAVSQGHDYRYKTNELVGSVLVCNEDVIHAAFFEADGNERPSRMSSSTQRGFFRRQRDGQSG